MREQDYVDEITAMLRRDLESLEAEKPEFLDPDDGYHFGQKVMQPLRSYLGSDFRLKEIQEALAAKIEPIARAFSDKKRQEIMVDEGMFREIWQAFNLPAVRNMLLRADIRTFAELSEKAQEKGAPLYRVRNMGVGSVAKVYLVLRILDEMLPEEAA